MNFTDSFPVAIINISSVFFNDLAAFLMKEANARKKKSDTKQGRILFSSIFFSILFKA